MQTNTEPQTVDDVRAELARRRILGREIAGRAGCSVASVSRVLHGQRRSNAVADAIAEMTGLACLRELLGRPSKKSPAGDHPAGHGPDGASRAAAEPEQRDAAV